VADGAKETPPVIKTQPASLARADGLRVGFSVQADGTAPFAYQWQRNGSAIPGATKASHATTARLADNGAKYSVTVRNAAGSATSEAATLTVGTAPVVKDQPRAVSVTEGESATFRVAAGGSAPLAYQWRRNGGNIDGATAAEYSVPATLITDSKVKYSVTVKNVLGSVTSDDAILIVKPCGFGQGLTAEYFDNTEDAVARLLWSGPSLAKQPVPMGRLYPAQL
jgi:hypothetical protein